MNGTRPRQCLLPFAYNKGQISYACTAEVQGGMPPEFLMGCSSVEDPNQSSGLSVRPLVWSRDWRACRPGIVEVFTFHP